MSHSTTRLSTSSPVGIYYFINRMYGHGFKGVSDDQPERQRRIAFWVFVLTAVGVSVATATLGYYVAKEVYYVAENRLIQKAREAANEETRRLYDSLQKANQKPSPRIPKKSLRHAINRSAPTRVRSIPTFYSKPQSRVQPLSRYSQLMNIDKDDMLYRREQVAQDLAMIEADRHGSGRSVKQTLTSAPQPKMSSGPAYIAPGVPSEKYITK